MHHSESVNISVCRFLRAKNSFGMLEGGENPWSGIEDPNATYRCNKTASVMGPDNNITGYKECAPGRKCYSGKAEGH